MRRDARGGKTQRLGLTESTNDSFDQVVTYHLCSQGAASGAPTPRLGRTAALGRLEQGWGTYT
jgi:hypothetical protein